MPFEQQEAVAGRRQKRRAYNAIVSQLHRSLYLANVGTDFVFPRDRGVFSVQAADCSLLYVADDALLTESRTMLRAAVTS